MSNKNDKDIIATISAMALSNAIADMVKDRGHWDKIFTGGSATKADNSGPELACACPGCSTSNEFTEPRDRVPVGRVMVINRLIRSVERLRALKTIDTVIDGRLKWLLTGITDPRLPSDTFSLAVRDIGDILDAEFSTLKPGTPDPIDRQDIIEGIRPEIDRIMARANLTETNRCAISALMIAVNDPGVSDATLSECIVALNRIITQVKRYS